MCVFGPSVVFHNRKARHQKGNSKNQSVGSRCRKTNLVVKFPCATHSEYIRQQWISFFLRLDDVSTNASTNWMSVLQMTKVIRTAKELSMTNLVQIYKYPIMKIPACSHKNLLGCFQTTRDINHCDILLIGASQEIILQNTQNVSSNIFAMGRKQMKPSCFLNHSGHHITFRQFLKDEIWLQYVQIDIYVYRFGKEQEILQRKRKQQCNKKHKKDVRHENICNQLISTTEYILGLFEGFNDETENDISMQLEYEALRQQSLEKDELINDKARECEILKGENSFLEKTCFLLEDKLSKLEEKYKKLENDHAELILEFGRLSVENDSKVNKVKKSEQFQKIFLSKSSVSSKATINNVESDNSCHSEPTPNVFMSDDGMKALPSSSSSSGEQSAGAGSSELLKSSASPGNFQHKGDENAQHAVNSRNESDVSAEEIQLSVEVVEGGNTEPISLLSQHSSSIPADVCNAYKLLLLTMSNMLLLTDIMKLQEWAKEMFSIQGNLNAYGIFLELDKKGVITALDLSKFCVFFESIVRHDLVHLINEFMKGDYDKLKKLAYQNKTRNNRDRRVSNSNRVVSSNRVVQPTSNNRGASERPVRNTRVNVSNAEVDLRNIRVNVSNSQVDLRNSQVNVDNSEVDLRNSNVNVNNSEVDLRNSQVNVNNSEVDLRNSPVNVNNSEVDLRNSHVNVNNGCHHQSAGRFPDVSAITNSGGNRSNDRNDTSVMTGQVREERTLQHPTSQCNTTHNPTGRCSGTHSHTDAGMHASSHGNRQDNWLCDHYKRRCLVKFECCDKYWPCHRCHNNLSTCGRRKLKSRDTTMVKCVECGKEQQFGQFCVSCNTQFADFFCGKCKHLTGTDDHPYHCDKCGICRIHGDRSFHCDVCGICLDVQLRGNHKCRPDSAHDECCICLEDAFTGCQILPCSHKVHKECATQMIRSGITRCPICRESFAHKLERRPVKRTTTRRR